MYLSFFKIQQTPAKSNGTAILATTKPGSSQALCARHTSVNLFLQTLESLLLCLSAIKRICNSGTCLTLRNVISQTTLSLALRGKGTLGHVDTKKAYWGADVQLHTILNSALHAREYSASRPRLIYLPSKSSVPIRYGPGWAPEPTWAF